MILVSLNQISLFPLTSQAQLKIFDQECSVYFYGYKILSISLFWFFKYFEIGYYLKASGHLLRYLINRLFIIQSLKSCFSFNKGN